MQPKRAIFTEIELRRLSAAKELREFAWALKRLADRYERCVHHPGEVNERKAAEWYRKAHERMARFKARRSSYLARIAP